MKILFTRFPLESRYGGAEVQTMSLMKGLIDRGHAVAFLGSCPTLLRLCRDESIPSAKLDIGPPPVTMWNTASFLWRKKRMQRLFNDAFDQIRPDVVCMLSLSEKLLLTEPAATQGARVFWIEHDRVGRWLTRNPWLSMLRRMSQCAMTVCVSELSRGIYLRLGWPTERTIAIANGVDVKRLTACHGEPVEPRHASSKANILRQAQDDTLKIGTIARLSHDKGIDSLIESIVDLPNVRLTIIGEGGEEVALRALIQAKKMDDRIVIQHHIDDLAGFYHSLDLFILASREHDPFGLTAAEAMLCGTATIVTSACGIAGYLQNERDAMIVKANDARALAEAIRRLSDGNFRARIAEEGRKMAEKKFSAKRMVRDYETLFHGSPSPRT